MSQTKISAEEKPFKRIVNIKRTHNEVSFGGTRKFGMIFGDKIVGKENIDHLYSFIHPDECFKLETFVLELDDRFFMNSTNTSLNLGNISKSLDDKLCVPKALVKNRKRLKEMMKKKQKFTSAFVEDYCLRLYIGPVYSPKQTTDGIPNVPFCHPVNSWSGLRIELDWNITKGKFVGRKAQIFPFKMYPQLPSWLRQTISRIGKYNFFAIEIKFDRLLKQIETIVKSMNRKQTHSHTMNLVIYRKNFNWDEKVRDYSFCLMQHKSIRYKKFPVFQVLPNQFVFEQMGKKIGFPLGGIGKNKLNCVQYFKRTFEVNFSNMTISPSSMELGKVQRVVIMLSMQTNMEDIKPNDGVNVVWHDQDRSVWEKSPMVYRFIEKHPHFRGQFTQEVWKQGTHLVLCEVPANKWKKVGMCFVTVTISFSVKGEDKPRIYSPRCNFEFLPIPKKENTGFGSFPDFGGNNDGGFSGGSGNSGSSGYFESGGGFFFDEGDVGGDDKEDFMNVDPKGSDFGENYSLLGTSTIAHKFFHSLFEGNVTGTKSFDFSTIPYQKLERVCSDFKNVKDAFGFNLLFWASYNGFTFLVDLLIKRIGYDIKLKDNFGLTCVDHCKDNPDVVKYYENYAKFGERMGESFNCVWDGPRDKVWDGPVKDPLYYTSKSLPITKLVVGNEAREENSGKLITTLSFELFEIVSKIKFTEFLEFMKCTCVDNLLLSLREVDFFLRFLVQNSVASAVALINFFELFRTFHPQETSRKGESHSKFTEFCKTEDAGFFKEEGIINNFYQYLYVLMEFFFFDITKWSGNDFVQWTTSHKDGVTDFVKKTVLPFKTIENFGNYALHSLYNSKPKILNHERYLEVSNLMKTFRAKKSVFEFSDLLFWFKNLSFVGPSLIHQSFENYLKENISILFTIDKKGPLRVLLVNFLGNYPFFNLINQRLLEHYIERLFKTKSFYVDGFDYYNILFNFITKTAGSKMPFQSISLELESLSNFDEYRRKFSYLDALLGFVKSLPHMGLCVFFVKFDVEHETQKYDPNNLRGDILEAIKNERKELGKEEITKRRIAKRIDKWIWSIQKNRKVKEMFMLKFVISSDYKFGIIVGPYYIYWDDQLSGKGDHLFVKPSSFFSHDSIYYCFGVEMLQKSDESIRRIDGVDNLRRKMEEFIWMAYQYNCTPSKPNYESDKLSLKSVNFLKDIFRLFDVKFTPQMEHMILKWKSRVNECRHNKHLYFPTERIERMISENENKFRSIEGVEIHATFTGEIVVQFLNHVGLDDFVLQIFTLMGIETKEKFKEKFRLDFFVLKSIDRAFWLKYIVDEKRWEKEEEEEERKWEKKIKNVAPKKEDFVEHGEKKSKILCPFENPLKTGSYTIKEILNFSGEAF